MTRVLALAPVALPAFIVTLALSALAIRAGFVSDDAAMLWAGAVSASEGQVPLGRIVASYPTIPFLATTGLQALVPAGTPGPALLAAALTALLAGLWLRAFRAAGFPLILAIVAVLLVAFHPAILRASIAGPAEILLGLFLFLFGRALYDLRAQSQAPEVMAAGLSLLALSFSHPIGAALAVAAIAFLPFAVRPAMIANSAINVVIALIFPALFCAAAFSYLSWVFPGTGWSFFGAPTESLSTWAAGFVRLFSISGVLALDAALAMMLTLALGAPIAGYALALAYRRRALVDPALVLAASVVTAAGLSVAIGLFGNPAALGVAAPVLAAIALTRIPLLREHRAGMIALLAAGWIGGAIGTVVLDPGAAAFARAAIEHRLADSDRSDALALGGAAAGIDGVLVDTDNSPLIVVGRGSARWLIAPADENFALTLLFSRLQTPFVALPDPHSLAGAQDRLAKAFPDLYRTGAQHYRLIYQNKTWRLFARDTAKWN